MLFKRINTPFVDRPLGRAIVEYDRGKDHGFFNQFHSVIILLVYQIFLAIAWDPRVLNYNSVDAWFTLLHSYVRHGTLFFSLAFIYIYSRNMIMAWFGLKNRQERAKDRAERRKKYKEGKTDWRPQLKSPYRPNWWYLIPILLGESLLWAFALFTLLRYVVFGMLVIPFEEIHISTSLDAVQSLKNYQSSPLQDLALAFGAGYYEEFIFRGLLFMLIAWAAGRVKFLSKLKINLINVKGIPLRYPEFKRDDAKFIYALLTAVTLYALSHYLMPFADDANMYTFFYRCFFGLAMYIIFVYRGWAVLIWVHTFYDLFYFMFAR